MTTEFSELTVQLTKQLSKAVKKEYGIFMTPKTILGRIFDRIDHYATIPFTDILEPSCGSCEMIRHMEDRYSGKSIDGVEWNETIYDRIRHITFTKNEVRIQHHDFAQFIASKEYDLIVANPPYVVCKKEDVPETYREFIVGRPNLFGTFILHSLSMLKIDGILAFIVPKSFLNAAYYSKIRNHIKHTCDILDILDFEENNQFLETQQSTFGILLRKKTNVPNVSRTECDFSVKFGDNFVFSENSARLKDLFVGSTSLKNLGLRVKTGTVVWNQHKDILTDDTSCALLVYNTNISKNNSFHVCEFSNDEKKQYIQMDGSRDRILVVNRGNGNAAYKLTYALLGGETMPEYLVENHLNMICSDTLIGEELDRLYAMIIASFSNPKTQEFIQTFLGNNGLSKTELETIFPIFTEPAN